MSNTLKRDAADRFDRIPAELKALPQWVAWDLRTRDGQPKPTKVPINPMSGELAKTNDPGTWGTFAQAVQASERFSGVGFVFTANDPYFGVDLDEGADAAWVEKFDSYAERSQSGKGFHIIGRGAVPDGKGRKRGAYEAYSQRRFFVMTGGVVRDMPIAERQAALDQFLMECLPERRVPTPRGPAGASPPPSGDVLDRIRRTPQGAKFERLWQGRWEGEYPSQSEADAALLAILRFWTGGSKGESFRLFEQSGLCRPKWREREDYRQGTWEQVDRGPVCKAGHRDDGPVASSKVGKATPGRSGILLPVRRLGEFRPPAPDDPNELLRQRFLSRGGGGLIVGPTGIGKSSFMLQAAISWSLGRAFAGIAPARALKVLTIQAENDDGDIAEMRDGIVAGLSEVSMLSEQDVDRAMARTLVCRDVTNTGDAFGIHLSELLCVHSDVDLVIADPAFAYVGGDALQARDVTHFLRSVVNPVLVNHGVGLLLVHHMNKPPRTGEAVEWRGSDHAYAGSGANEWANWPRCVLSIRNIGSERLFELRASKRGKRLGWLDDDGRPTTVRYIMHHTRHLFWCDPTEEDIARELERTEKSAKKTRPTAESVFEEVVKLVLAKVWKVRELQEYAKRQWCLGNREVGQLVLKLEAHPDVHRVRTNLGLRPVHLIGAHQAVDAEAARMAGLGQDRER